MPKLNINPITEENINEYLKTDDDFQFEISILRELSSRSIKCEHGGTYIDPHKNVARQFDFRALIKNSENKSIYLSIECKNLKPYFPLLVSSLPRRVEEAYNQIIIPGTNSVKKLQATKHINKYNFYEPNQPCGKSTNQIGLDDKNKFLSSDSEVYEKWSQAIASSADLVEFAWRKENLKGKYVESASEALILPVLVVPNDTLWQVCYDMDGSIHSPLKKADKAEIYIDKTITSPIEYKLSHLHIYTVNGFCEFLDEVIGVEFNNYIFDYAFATS